VPVTVRPETVMALAVPTLRVGERARGGAADGDAIHRVGRPSDVVPEPVVSAEAKGGSAGEAGDGRAVVDARGDRDNPGDVEGLRGDIGG
jgi:hypothetical protein